MEHPLEARPQRLRDRLRRQNRDQRQLTVSEVVTPFFRQTRCQWSTLARRSGCVWNVGSLEPSQHRRVVGEALKTVGLSAYRVFEQIAGEAGVSEGFVACLPCLLEH